MKNACYYARVSTSLQEEQGTIESQKNELIKQIKNDGNVLVKEYIDNGWSGARLDRPALDELRNDLKSDIFDVVYFLDTDRIARDTAYQNIIIAELIKYEKEIIIKGQNYVDNPENKFHITVIGAANELEKAKIMERTMRGRREKARQGAIVDSGGLLGYNHIKKTDTKDGYYTINETQAEIVKFIYQTYANTTISLNGLVKLLEEKGHKTATGKNYWKSAVVRRILTNTSYYGEHYFNMTYKVEPKKKRTPKKYAKSIKSTARLRDKKEWIMIPIPKIISKDLFDLVQTKLKRNSKFKRNNSDKYLLSGLIQCGQCEHTYSGTTWNGEQFYKCNYRDKRYNHIESVDLAKCDNKAIKGNQVEQAIDNIVNNKILKPSIIKQYIDVLSHKVTTSKKQIKNKLKKIDNKIKELETKKKRILDLYADNLVTKDDYINKINELEKQGEKYEDEKKEVEQKVSLMSQRKEIRADVSQFCRLARQRYNKLDRPTKILFIQRLISEIVLYKNNTKNQLVIRGGIPLSGTIDFKSLPQYCKGHWRGLSRRRTLSSPRRNKHGASRNFISG